MAKFKLSAFADEYSPRLDEQIEGLLKNKLRMMEIRGVDGINVAELTPVQAMEVKKKLDSVGISVSAIGSPIGKSSISEPVDAQLEKLKRVCETAAILQTDRIRVFSFYMPQGDDPTAYKNEVIDRLGRMLDIADEFDVTLCHENEKGIYGDVPTRCHEILEEFDGRLGCVLDPANFIQCGCAPLEAYSLLAPHIAYMHIKDAEKNGTIVPAGCGVGTIPEILAVLNNARKGEVILTVEPHLRTFDGISDLEPDKHGRSVPGAVYATSAEAFEAAIRWTRECFPRTCEVEEN